MSNLTDFFPSGGGGLTPKFEEFNASGTFTPSQALIDAGGYIEVFLVAGGGGGRNNLTTSKFGGQGGEAQKVGMYLTSVAGCTVTIGSGGLQSTAPTAGSNSFFGGSAAGGDDVTSVGGKGSSGSSRDENPMKSPSWAGRYSSGGFQSPGNGIDGYGAGGGTSSSSGPGIGGSSGSLKSNTGQGGMGGSDDTNSSDGSSGYCLINWYE